MADFWKFIANIDLQFSGNKKKETATMLHIFSTTVEKKELQQMQQKKDIGSDKSGKIGQLKTLHRKDRIIAHTTPSSPPRKIISTNG